jgi:Carboxylesterase family
MASIGYKLGNLLFILQESGSLFNTRDITDQQPLFDQLVADTNCTGSADTIACLRAVPIDQLMTAINTFPNLFSYTSFLLGWQPSVDGDFIVRDPQVSVQQGIYAKACLQVLFSFCFSPAEGFCDRFHLLLATAMMKERM